MSLGRTRARGLSLVEMLVVLVILAAIAALVAPMLLESAYDSRHDTTLVSLTHARTAVVGEPSANASSGFLSDARRMPKRTVELFERPADVSDFDPSTSLGWRGPYLVSSTGSYHIDRARGFTAAYGEEHDPAILDGFGSAIVLQIPDRNVDGVITRDDERFARVVSAGPNGFLETPIDAHFPPRSACGDDIVLYLRAADSRPD